MKGKARRIIGLIKLGVFIGTVLFIYLKLRDNRASLQEAWDLAGQAFASGYLIILFTMALMPFNWSLEALKWQCLSSGVVKLSFRQALKGVLSGLALGFVTPHGLGDYLGRIGMVGLERRTRLLGGIFTGRACQMLVTAMFGLIGVSVLFPAQTVLLTVGALFASITLFFALRRLLKGRWLEGRGLKTLVSYVKIIAEFDLVMLVKVFTYSLLRYLVFSLQFFLILDLLLPKLEPAIKFSGITWIFLAKSVLPTFNFLSDLGVREMSAIYFFEQFQVAVEPVIIASLLLWLVNILTPTLLSLPLIFQLKFRPA
ncbi:MAG: hypothetical protein MJA30_29150 [Cytophagales bacterium]|nr:hypothetical protein [Cytophagales bacterium]